MAIKDDEHNMSTALAEARKAAEKGEVPIGAVIVVSGKIISRAHNLKESSSDPTAHAEVIAIRKAAKLLGGWRVPDSTLYVTLEPCLMCMGAMIQARIERVVFSSFDPKGGACGTLYDVSDDKRLNHRIKVTSGVSEDKSSALLKKFFSNLRKKTRGKK